MKNRLKMIIPKGRIQEKVVELLSRVGLGIRIDARSYRPSCGDPDIELKLLKPQNIPMLIALGRHDCGFCGYDWMIEQKADVVELLDLGFDPVRIVSAVPVELKDDYISSGRQLVVASEYKMLATDYLKKKRINAVFVQTHGATEALPPEDADMIIDNTSSGDTLCRNGLKIVDEIMRSTTRFVCSQEAFDDVSKRKKLEELCLFMRSTINAQSRVLLEMNVPADNLGDVVKILPCMRAPTVSPLHREEGFAVKAAVPTSQVPALITMLMKLGARDILEYKLEKIVT